MKSREKKKTAMDSIIDKDDKNKIDIINSTIEVKEIEESNILFSSSKKLKSEDKARKMLEKMGWKAGQGLIIKFI